MEICLTFILLSSTLTLAAADVVRLMNGESRCSGRVEVLHGGQWGTVCDDGWDLKDATVVCRELRCGEAVDALGDNNAHYGPGSGPIWMANVYCTGSETTLKNCRSVPWGKHNCGHGEDAGVTCSENVNVRLAAGPHQCSGRVEVLHGGSWSTACDANFDQQDAEVVCRQLGCGIPVKVLGSAAFGRGNDQVWTKELQCKGNESEIFVCPTSSSLKHSNCSHDNDVGLICSGHTEARLVNGTDSCSGRVEIRYLSKWGTVCAVSWDMRAADVLCAQLGCGSAVAVVEVDWFGEGSGDIWADVFDCQEKETHLSQCDVTSWSRAACSHKHDAGVICNGSTLAFHEGRVRLSGGSECQGELEVYFRQDWRRVLLDSWSLSAASVLCRQLRCGPVLDYGSSRSTTAQKHTCVTGFSCSGSEAYLGNCSSAPAEPVNCSSEEQLYITCSVPKSIRLVGSGGDCAGRLEVFHRGSWGTVCDDSWDINDAQVVCRQLQCGKALRTHILAWFGPGTGSIWLNNVECEGNETSLWNCRFQLSEKGECGHQEDVGVMCTEFNEIQLTEGCKGNLEVFYNGTWGNVCSNRMDPKTANLVCRELNCGTDGYMSFRARARVKSAPNWLDNVQCRKHDSELLKCPSLPWGQNRCNNPDEVVQITCTAEEETSLRPHGTCSAGPLQKYCSNHWPLRLSGGKGRCSGMLEVFYNSTWISVCDDQWNMSNARVVCRQLGCGSALRAERNAPSGSGDVTIRVKCRGNEIHLWDCFHSLKKHTDCSYARVTCAEFSVDPEISIVSSTTPSTTPKSVSVGRNPALPGAPSVPPLVLIVLGVLLFLTSVLSLVLFYQNRVLRRVVSKSPPEAVYEEINHGFLTRRRRSFSQRGSLLSEEQHSGYEHVDDELLSVKSVFGEKAEDYDDAITTRDIISGCNDDAVPAGPAPGSDDDDEAEHHHDDVTADPKSVLLTGTTHEPTNRTLLNDITVSEYYDDVISTGTSPNISTEGYDDAMAKNQDAGEAEGYDDAMAKNQDAGEAEGYDDAMAKNQDAGEAEGYDDAMAKNQDAGEAEDYDDAMAKNQDAGEAEDYDDAMPKNQDAGEAEDYDDAMPKNQDAGEAEDYDDAMPKNQDAGEAEDYDDAMPKNQDAGEAEDYDDAMPKNQDAGEAEDYDDAMPKNQDAGEAEEYDDVEEKSHTDGSCD